MNDKDIDKESIGKEYMNKEYKVYCSFENENGEKGFFVRPFIMRLNNGHLEFKSPSYLRKGEKISFDVPHIVNGHKTNYFIKIFTEYNIKMDRWAKANIDSESIKVLKEGFVEYEKEVEEIESTLRLSQFRSGQINKMG